MAYFPFYINLEAKKCLVVGAGPVGVRKIATLLEFGAKVTLVARELSPEVQDFRGKITIECRDYVPSDLLGQDFVFIAASRELAEEIYPEAKKQGILVNAADIPELCDFYFPAVVKRGDLVIGIGTGGNAPALSGIVRRHISETIPDELQELTCQISALRKSILEKGLRPIEDKQFCELLESCKKLLKDVGNK